MGSRRRIVERLTAKLLEELRACAAYFNRAAIVARDLKMLRSLTFRAVRKLTCSLYVASGGGSDLGLSDQFCPCPPFRIARNQFLELMSVSIGKSLAARPA